MNRRFLIWGVAAATFAVTLAISSWNNGLWQSDPVDQANNTVRRPLVLASRAQAPLRPFAPAATSSAVSAPAPASATTTPVLDPELDPAPSPAPPAPPPPPEYPPDTAPPPEMTESLLESGPGVDNEDVLARRDQARAERRNAESH
jgi:hypothetical protein